MAHLGQLIWLVPLALHAGYFVATFLHFPPILKMAEQSDEIARWHFVTGWCAVIGAANLAFLVLIIWLPRMRDSMLQVPGKNYWLSTSGLKNELVSRLRSVCSSALFGLNIFFLAVYQLIYQSHVSRPYLAMSQVYLVIFFMIIPLIVSLFSMVLTLRNLAADGSAAQNTNVAGGFQDKGESANG